MLVGSAASQRSVVPAAQGPQSPLYPGGSRDRHRTVQKLLATETVRHRKQRLVVDKRRGEIHNKGSITGGVKKEVASMATNVHNILRVRGADRKSVH